MSRQKEIIKMHSRYFNVAVTEPETVIARAMHDLEGVNFDTLVGTGMSGGVIIPELARAMGKHWLLIRKDGAASHSADPAVGELGRRWVFFDDFVSTGTTRNRVKNVVKEICQNHHHYDWATRKYKHYRSTYVGTYEYQFGGRFSPASKGRGGKI